MTSLPYPTILDKASHLYPPLTTNPLKQMDENPRAQEAILEAIKQQIESPESPYVKKHYDRLIIEGHEEDETMQLLSSVLAAEMWEMSTQKRAFNEKGYIQRLEKLPDLNWMDE